MRGTHTGAGSAATFTLPLAACSSPSPEPDVVDPRQPGPPQVSPDSPGRGPASGRSGRLHPLPPYCFGPLPPDDHYPT